MLLVRIAFGAKPAPRIARITDTTIRLRAFDDSGETDPFIFTNVTTSITILSAVGKFVSHSWASLFETVCIRIPSENSVLSLEAPQKRESESSGPIFRTGGCNLEGYVRETEISLQTESAASWSGDTRKALKTRERPGRNENRPAIDLSTPGVKSVGRQSSHFDASSPKEALFGTFSVFKKRLGQQKHWI